MRSLAAITIDVEWAHPEVLDYVVRELDARNLRATFFCTHAGIDVGAHERGVHPNYRRHGNSLLEANPAMLSSSDQSYYERITEATMTFCPEAIGTRSHHLFWESGLASICRRAGIRYTSNSLAPFARNAQPVDIGNGLTELPIYYMDHWDLAASATSFRVADLRLETEGLKVLDFHPNLVFINARSLAHYDRSKRSYHEPSRLLEVRSAGRGIQTLFLETLDFLAVRSDHVFQMRDIAPAAINAAFARNAYLPKPASSCRR